MGIDIINVGALASAMNAYETFSLYLCALNNLRNTERVS
jgi:hypothetical protein